ncbi:MAG TPA: hypothetical protein VFX88_04255 [Actinomycetota bacterium]|nr:hypothetical protein [Actinomycetota bacterium]
MLQVPHDLASQGPAAGLIPPGSAAFHLLLAVLVARALARYRGLAPHRPTPSRRPQAR